MPPLASTPRIAPKPAHLTAKAKLMIRSPSPTPFCATRMGNPNQVCWVEIPGGCQDELCCPARRRRGSKEISCICPPSCVRPLFMTEVSPLTQLQLYAPDFARRFALIMTALAAIIGRRMGRDPRFVSVIVPLWNRINRLARRFERLMAGFVAGKLRQPRQPGAPRPGGPHASVLPRGRFWLIRVLGYEACGCASQLEALLAEAAAVALLAEVPAAGRIIRPLGRMPALR